MTAEEKNFMKESDCLAVRPENIVNNFGRFVVGILVGAFVYALTMFILGPDMIDSGRINVSAYVGVTSTAMLFLAVFALFRPRESRRWFLAGFGIGGAAVAYSWLLAISVFQITSVLGFRLP